MDPRYLGMLIPILALLTGLVAVIRMPRHALAPARGGDDDADEEIAALREENATLHRQLAEAHDRVEFMERLLQGRPDAPRLPVPAASGAPLESPLADVRGR